MDFQAAFVDCRPWNARATFAGCDLRVSIVDGCGYSCTQRIADARFHRCVVKTLEGIPGGIEYWLREIINAAGIRGQAVRETHVDVIRERKPEERELKTLTAIIDSNIIIGGGGLRKALTRRGKIIRVVNIVSEGSAKISFHEVLEREIEPKERGESGRHLLALCYLISVRRDVPLTAII